MRSKSQRGLLSSEKTELEDDAASLRQQLKHEAQRLEEARRLHGDAIVMVQKLEQEMAALRSRAAELQLATAQVASLAEEKAAFQRERDAMAAERDAVQAVLKDERERANTTLQEHRVEMERAVVNGRWCQRGWW